MFSRRHAAILIIINKAYPMLFTTTRVTMNKQKKKQRKPTFKKRNNIRNFTFKK